MPGQCALSLSKGTITRFDELSAHCKRPSLSPRTARSLQRQAACYLLVPCETDPCSCRWKIR